MRAALSLARRGLGNVWPNPAVGCVITNYGNVIARGWTQPGGRPHSEVEALNRAGSKSKGSTVYVTLEPCAHHGQTSSCAQALVEAGVSCVYVACRDPDERVNGKGIEVLKNSNIEVHEGLELNDAIYLNAGFFSKIQHSRPLVTIKLASSLDGKIATHNGESKWITSEVSRAKSFMLRSSYDAVAVGSGTVIADDPELTCRLPGLKDSSPIRVIFDGSLRTPIDSKVVKSAKQFPTWILTNTYKRNDKVNALINAGVELIEVPCNSSGRPIIKDSLEIIASKGITRLLVEGGSKLNTSLLKNRLVDRLAWFRAPSLIGQNSTPVFNSIGVDSISEMINFDRTEVQVMGTDLLEIYSVKH